MEDDKITSVGSFNTLIGESMSWKNPTQDILTSTWETLSCDTCIARGQNAGQSMTNAKLCVLYGPGVGSTITDEVGIVLIALPNGRLLRADLKAETAEFMDYSDDAAMVAPEFRKAT